jgi:hypothetical protein
MDACITYIEMFALFERECISFLALQSFIFVLGFYPWTSQHYRFFQDVISFTSKTQPRGPGLYLWGMLPYRDLRTPKEPSLLLRCKDAWSGSLTDTFPA